MKRVLFVCPNLDGGGAERQWAILIPRLREHGFEPRVLTLDGEGRFFDELRDVGVPADCASMRTRRDVRGLRRALSLVGGRPDVVVSRGVSAQVVAQLIASRNRVPHVVTNHASTIGLLRRDQRTLLRVCAGRAAHVVTVARAQLPELERLGYERVSVIPNAVDEQAFAPTRRAAAVRAELGLPEQDFLALLVANLRPEKRVDRFVKAVSRAYACGAPLRGVVVGGGSEAARVTALAGASGGAVRVLGPRSDIPDLMRAADAVCLTSDAEAMPMVLLEAMALGRPVVSTDVGGVSEVVVHGVTGLLVPPDEDALAGALGGLAREPLIARRLGEHGAMRQRELFSVKRMVAAYADLFAALATLPRGSRLPSLDAVVSSQ